MEFETIERDAEVALRSIRGFWDGLPDGYVFNEDIYSSLTKRLAAHLNVDPYIMYNSAAFYVGRMVTKEICYDMCYIACANKKAMKHDVVPFRSQALNIQESCIVRFLSIKYSEDLAYITAKVQCLTGRHALCTATTTVPLDFAYTWMTRIGYNNKIEDPFSSGPPSACLPGLFARVILKPHPDATIQNVKLEVEKSDEVLKRNRITILHRVGEEWCPKHRDEQVGETAGYCAIYCPYGWNDCPYSGHSETYQIGTCPECGKTNVSMDPVHVERCVHCQREREGYTEID